MLIYSKKKNKGESKIYWFNTEASETANIFGSEFFGFLVAMVPTVTLALSAGIFIITAQKVKHGKMMEGNAAKLWALMAILIIASMIFWLIAVEYYYGIYSANISKGYPSIVKHIFGDRRTSQFGFWSFFNPTFGVYGPFLAAGIALIGVYVK